MFNILILDDEKLVCNSLKRLLENQERKVFIAHKIDQADEILRDYSIDLILLDYKLEGEDGITYLKELKGRIPEMTVIMISAHGNIDLAVEAMREGAFDFIQKNQEPAFIKYTVQRTLENLRLKKEVEDLKNQYLTQVNLPRFISKSQKMQQILSLAEAYAKSDSTLFIGGETGTGKSLMAKYIHYKSNRFNRPFVSLNCSAIPGELIESELFGYKKGAFTGAGSAGKSGLVEKADSGTLFLDEIGDLQPELQAKLLHVIENKEFIPVGGVEPTRVDIRIIAASNADMQEKVSTKEFRMDLFYRLNVASLQLPPLRERPDDILPLSKYFIEEFNKKYNKSVNNIQKEAESFLLKRSWKGNVRELKNQIERAMILKKDYELKFRDFSNPLVRIAEKACEGVFTITLEPGKGINIFEQARKKIIEQALGITNNNVSQAANLLGLPRTTLNHYLQKTGIR